MKRGPSQDQATGATRVWAGACTRRREGDCVSSASSLLPSSSPWGPLCSLQKGRGHPLAEQPSERSEAVESVFLVSFLSCTLTPQPVGTRGGCPLCWPSQLCGRTGGGEGGEARKTSCCIGRGEREGGPRIGRKATRGQEQGVCGVSGRTQMPDSAIQLHLLLVQGVQVGEWDRGT